MSWNDNIAQLGEKGRELLAGKAAAVTSILSAAERLEILERKLRGGLDGPGAGQGLGGWHSSSKAAKRYIITSLLFVGSLFSLYNMDYQGTGVHIRIAQQ
jgi:hypothetical protein